MAPKFLKAVYLRCFVEEGNSHWFSNAESQFRKYLLPRKDEGLKCLQIGVFRGDATVWLINNILTNENSSLDDVDTWEGSSEHKQLDMNFGDVEKEYDARVDRHPRVRKNRMSSDKFFSLNLLKYDFKYIDGDHSKDQVIKDANNAINCCRLGGIIAFDDYDWNRESLSDNRPKEAIDAFISNNRTRVKILHHEYQLWIEVIG